MLKDLPQQQTACQSVVWATLATLECTPFPSQIGNRTEYGQTACMNSFFERYLKGKGEYYILVNMVLSYSETLYHVHWQIVTNTEKECSASITQFKKTAWPLWCKHSAPLKCQQLFSSQHGLTSQRSWVFIIITLRAWSLSGNVNAEP